MPLTIGYLILIFNLIPKLYYNKMYADYTRLLINEPQILECRNKLFTTAWIDQIKRDGYDLVQEDMKHILLCKYYKKLPGISSSDRTLAFIVIAKTDSFDFYGDEIDNGVQAFYMKHKDYEKIDKRVTLQFKKYDQLDEQAIEEIEKAILYQAGKQVLINLSFVYNSDKQSLSGLNPNGFYPNRYAYFAFSECKRLCDIKE